MPLIFLSRLISPKIIEERFEVKGFQGNYSPANLCRCHSTNPRGFDNVTPFCKMICITQKSPPLPPPKKKLPQILSLKLITSIYLAYSLLATKMFVRKTIKYTWNISKNHVQDSLRSLKVEISSYNARRYWVFRRSSISDSFIHSILDGPDKTQNKVYTMVKIWDYIYDYRKFNVTIQCKYDPLI